MQTQKSKRMKSNSFNDFFIMINIYGVITITTFAFTLIFFSLCASLSLRPTFPNTLRSQVPVKHPVEYEKICCVTRVSTQRPPGFGGKCSNHSTAFPKYTNHQGPDLLIPTAPLSLSFIYFYQLMVVIHAHSLTHFVFACMIVVRISLYVPVTSGVAVTQ